MKFVKLSIFALTMGLFIASCGNGEGNKEADTTVVVPVTPPADTVTTATTTVVAPADSTAKPMDTTHTSTTTEVKH